jgi:hypothetical protein
MKPVWQLQFNWSLRSAARDPVTRRAASLRKARGRSPTPVHPLAGSRFARLRGDGTIRKEIYENLID